MLVDKLKDRGDRRPVKEFGFTLIELLVVVVLIVAIAAIAVPTFLNQKEKADEGRLQSDIFSVGKIVATGAGTESPVTFSGGTIGTAEGSRAGVQSATIDGTITGSWISGTVPPADACVTITQSGTNPLSASFRLSEGIVESCN